MLLKSFKLLTEKERGNLYKVIKESAQSIVRNSENNLAIVNNNLTVIRKSVRALERDAVAQAVLSVDKRRK